MSIKSTKVIKRDNPWKLRQDSFYFIQKVFFEMKGGGKNGKEITQPSVVGFSQTSKEKGIAASPQNDAKHNIGKVKANREAIKIFIISEYQ